MVKGGYTQEVINYALEMIERGCEIGYIKSLLAEKFKVNANEATIECWFRRTRKEFMPVGVSSEIIDDAVKLNARIEKFKEQAKPGLMLIYVGEVPDTKNRPRMKEKRSIIKKVYRHFILTEDGCVQFSDVKGVIIFG